MNTHKSLNLYGIITDLLWTTTRLRATDIWSFRTSFSCHDKQKLYRYIWVFFWWSKWEGQILPFVIQIFFISRCDWLINHNVTANNCLRRLFSSHLQLCQIKMAARFPELSEKDLNSVVEEKNFKTGLVITR